MCNFSHAFVTDIAITEHKVFFTELATLSEADDTILQKYPCFKTVTNLVPVRKSAMKALTACHYIPQSREKIFSILYKALNSTNNELQEVAFECLQKLIAAAPIDMEIVSSVVK